ncbi:M20 family metallopeptidase [Alkalibacterium iburiense]|uniref:M20 family metallopeptidase n=1 Tax=Alkalibacterium iburiense TaxID=290589 RepID=A0ABP3HG73_9LACT
MSELKAIEAILKKRKNLILGVSEKIWNYAELSYEEYQSAKLLSSVLEKENFTIDRGVADIPTAFTARFTSGKGTPVFGFLGEYDALDGLSQEAGNPKQAPIEKGQSGHGCGHNALGSASLGAALAVKDYLVKNNLDGTVLFFGCPGEEGAGSKQFMARAGVFDDVDFVYTWHPSTTNEVQSHRSVAIMGANFHFKGISSHAGSAPHLGRSALDAAELMSVGSNYLREHMINQARIHYAYSDVGGSAPNVVQDRSTVKYEVRAPKMTQVYDLFDRVVNVAKGAALMTETEMDYEITMAFSDYIPNNALAEVAYEALNEVGAPEWSEEDYQLASQYLSSYNEATLNQIKEKIAEEYGEEKVEAVLKRPLDSMVRPYTGHIVQYESGSTDVGDVSYTVPTINFLIATACIGNIGHTWQMTGQACSPIAHKGLMTAAKVMALAAIKTMQRPETIQKAKKSVLQQNGGSYQCPLPDDVKPPIGTY